MKACLVNASLPAILWRPHSSFLATGDPSDDFEILQATENKAKQELEKQQIKRCNFKHLPDMKNNSKVALGPCEINNVSESKHDKNGKPYRSTRLTDEAGYVANAMVWGSLAQMDHIWQSGAIVNIMGADVNNNEQRVNLRNCSQITMSAKPENFKRRNQLFFIPWPVRQTWLNGFLHTNTKQLRRI